MKLSGIYAKLKIHNSFVVKEKCSIFAPKFNIQSYTSMKIQVTQDTLYEYMLAHDVKLSRLAELIGKSREVVFSCFKHHKDPRGKPRYFSHENIEAINQALPVLAQELQQHLLTFGSPQTYTNRWGNTYDPALIEPIKELGHYLNITAMTGRVLGWKPTKKTSVLVQTTCISYGCISEADAIAINNEILSIVGVLSSYTLIAD